jgi:multiple sugar transport system permease protein
MSEAGVMVRSVPRRGWRLSSSGLAPAAPFLIPALVALVVLRLWPMAEAVVSSLSVGPLGGAATRFGLDNYVFLLTSPDAAMTLRATLLFSLVTNPLQVVMALALALLLSQNLRWVGLWRTLIFLPIAVPQAVAAVVWGVAFRPDGPLNAAATFPELGRPGSTIAHRPGVLDRCWLLDDVPDRRLARHPQELLRGRSG